MRASPARACFSCPPSGPAPRPARSTPRRPSRVVRPDSPQVASRPRDAGAPRAGDDDDAPPVAAKAADSVVTAADEAFMRRALDLAATAAGKTFPNPLVGCVIVDDTGAIVGEGYHPKAGEPHAEVFALRAAGDLAEGATAYVSLEPCNHFGRTPPCSRALVAAGVRRVVVGFVDPDPRVSGGGIRTLLDAGIEVAVGCEEGKCREINADFIERNTKR